MRVGSCDENACDEKSGSCDGAAKFWNAGASGVNGGHAESPSWFSSRKPVICWIGVSSSTSKAFKLEMIGFQPEKFVCESVSFSSTGV